MNIQPIDSIFVNNNTIPNTTNNSNNISINTQTLNLSINGNYESTNPLISLEKILLSDKPNPRKRKITEEKKLRIAENTRKWREDRANKSIEIDNKIKQITSFLASKNINKSEIDALAPTEQEINNFVANQKTNKRKPLESYMPINLTGLDDQTFIELTLNSKKDTRLKDKIIRDNKNIAWAKKNILLEKLENYAKEKFPLDDIYSSTSSTFQFETFIPIPNTDSQPQIAAQAPITTALNLTDNQAINPLASRLVEDGIKDTKISQLEARNSHLEKSIKSLNKTITYLKKTNENLEDRNTFLEDNFEKENEFLKTQNSLILEQNKFLELFNKDLFSQNKELRNDNTILFNEVQKLKSILNNIINSNQI